MSYKEKQSNCSSFYAIKDHNKSFDSEDPVLLMKDDANLVWYRKRRGHMV